MKRRRILITIVVLGILAVCTFLIIYGSYGVLALAYGRNPLTLTPTSAEREAETHRRGDTLVAALKQFKQDHGSFPDRLDELVPSYVSKIEPPVVGDGVWKYRTDPAKGFVLSCFIGPMYQTDWYEGTADHWFADR